VANGYKHRLLTKQHIAPLATTPALLLKTRNGIISGRQNKAAYSTPRNYSSLYASPSLPTIGYGDAGAAQAAASQAGAGKATAYIGNYDILKGMDPGKDPQAYWEQRSLVDPEGWRSAWYNESGLTAPQKLIAQDTMEQNSAYNPSTKTMYDLTTGEPTSWQPTVHDPGTPGWWKQTGLGVDPLPKGGQFSVSDIPWAEMANTSPTNTTKALFDRSASVDNRYSGQTAYNAAGRQGAAGAGVLAQTAQGMSSLSSQFSPAAGRGITVGRGQSGSTWHAPNPNNLWSTNRTLGRTPLTANYSGIPRASTSSFGRGSELVGASGGYSGGRN